MTCSKLENAQLWARLLSPLLSTHNNRVKEFLHWLVHTVKAVDPLHLWHLMTQRPSYQSYLILSLIYTGSWIHDINSQGRLLNLSTTLSKTHQLQSTYVFKTLEKTQVLPSVRNPTVFAHFSPTCELFLALLDILYIFHFSQTAECVLLSSKQMDFSWCFIITLVTYSLSRTHSHADGRGCHARCQLANDHPPRHTLTRCKGRQDQIPPPTPACR